MGPRAIIDERDHEMSQRDTDPVLSHRPSGPPAGYFVVIPPGDEQNSALSRFGSDLRASWKTMLVAGLLGAVAAVGISYAMRNVYRAKVLLAPVTQEHMGESGGLGEQLGGLAELAGVSIGGNEEKEQAFASLSSDDFARDFIVSHNLLPILFAKQWDAKGGRWRAGTKPPTLEAGVRKFTHSVRFVTENHNTGLVTLMVEWYSPQLVATWANDMVEMINERLRAEAMDNANRSIEFLNKELAKNTMVEPQQAISRLIEEQVNRAMFASVQRDYAFHVIDRAVVPDIRFSPQRPIMALIGLAAGLFLGALIVLVRRPRSAARP